MTKTERLKEQGTSIDACENYVWYKVYYNVYFSNGKYITFDYCLNTADFPHNVQNLVNKLGDDFIAVIEWTV